MLLENIKVVIRIKPINHRDLEIQEKCTLKVLDQETLAVIAPVEEDVKQSKRTYKFNWIFDQVASQKDIFEKTFEYQVLSLLDGINVTLFSYGASGTGKTHTLMKLNEDYGLLIRALNQLYQTIHNKKRKVQMKFSYLELQQEQLYDLLNNMNSNLDIRDDVEKGIVISGMREIDVASTQEVINLIQYGKRQKSTKQHEILIFTNYIQDIVGSNNEITVSKFIIADLAGFEKGGQKSASLQVLNDCISLLSEAQSKSIQPFIPYRNSKLTKILKDSFCGNSKTLIIGCVSPQVTNYEETIQTLEYCSMAAGIFNQGTIKNLQQSNHQEDFKSIYDQLKNENVELKKQLNHKPNQKTTINNNEKEQTKLYEENIIEHFNNEQDINQSIFKYQWEIEQIKFTVNESQENLQRIDGIDRNAADSLRYQIEQDQKQVHNYQEQLIKFQMQASNFPIQRRALEENVNQSNLSNSYKLYLTNLIEKHILRLEVYEIKLKEQINELHRQQHERIMAIQRSQISLRDRIIADQRKHIIQHGKNQSVQHYSQIDTTTEVIDGTKAKLKHYPLPKIKDHYFNREAYLRESPKSIFSPRLQAPLQLKEVKPYVPKTPRSKILDTLSTPILPKPNALAKAPPQKIIDSKSMVALPLQMNKNNFQVIFFLSLFYNGFEYTKKLKKLNKYIKIQIQDILQIFLKVELKYSLSIITTNRNLSKFVYDWRGGGYKFIDEQKKIPSQRELKQIILSKQHTQQSLEKSFFTTSSRSTSAKRVSFKQSILLPGKVHESPYVKEFINKETQRKMKLKQLNQKMMKATQKK